jgi:Na+/proline symporter
LAKNDGFNEALVMRRTWELISRLSGGALAISAVLFLTLPAAFHEKKVFGILCAIFGLICVVTMYLAKKPEHADELQIVNRELRQSDIDDDNSL